MSDSTRKKPRSKPHPQFPLFRHASGRWAKKVRQKFVYFGKVADDPKGVKALSLWLEQKDHLLAGRIPPKVGGGLTVGDLCNRVLNMKRMKVADGDLTLRTFKTWHVVCEMVVKQFGVNRLVETVGPDDFEALLRTGISGRAASTRSLFISFTRSLFDFACNRNQRLIAAPVLFGEAFQPPKLTRKTDRSPSEMRLFTAEQLREILGFVRRQMKALVLLGINCGFGNNDIATLTHDHIDLDTGWHNFSRPKTGQPRRCPLWPETVDAIRETLRIRPKPQNPAHKNLVFLTCRGLPYIRLTDASAAALAEGKDGADMQWVDSVSTNMWAVLKRLGMKRDGLSFYTLRHTFETIAGGSKDQIAVDYIMGHKTPGMGTNYRQTIEDDRLLAVTDHVHKWLFGANETK